MIAGESKKSSGEAWTAGVPGRRQCQPVGSRPTYCLRRRWSTDRSDWSTVGFRSI